MSSRQVGTSPLFTVHSEADRYRLYRGDGLHVLPTLSPGSVDSLITDPPYCSGGTTARERSRPPEDKYCQDGNLVGRPTFEGDCRDQRSFIAWCALWLSLSRRAVRPGGYAMIFTDWRQLPAMTDALQAAGWLWRGIVPWDKGRGARSPHKGYFRHQCEYVLWGTNGRCEHDVDIGPLDGCITEPVRRDDKHHVTGKPTDLMKRLVARVPAGQTILDPFAGSCSTGVAALLQGYRFVGIERPSTTARLGPIALPPRTATSSFWRHGTCPGAPMRRTSRPEFASPPWGVFHVASLGHPSSGSAFAPDRGAWPGNETRQSRRERRAGVPLPLAGGEPSSTDLVER